MKRFNLLAIVVMVALASASQAQQYRVTDLGTLGGSFSGATSVNYRGVIAGFSTLSGDVQSNAVTWTKGSITSLGTLGGNNSTANGINSSGFVVGSADLSDGVTTHAFLFATTMTDLGSLAAGEGINSVANGINRRGYVTGTSYLSDFLTQHAFLWSSKTGTLTDLGTLPGGTNSYGNAINGSGIVVGASDTAAGGTDAALWFVRQQGITVVDPVSYTHLTLPTNREV